MLLTGCLNDFMFMFGVSGKRTVSLVCEECKGVEGFGIGDTRDDPGFELQEAVFGALLMRRK